MRKLFFILFISSLSIFSFAQEGQGDSYGALILNKKTNEFYFSRCNKTEDFGNGTICSEFEVFKSNMDVPLEYRFLDLTSVGVKNETISYKMIRSEIESIQDDSLKKSFIQIFSRKESGNIYSLSKKDFENFSLKIVTLHSCHEILKVTKSVNCGKCTLQVGGGACAYYVRLNGQGYPRGTGCTENTYWSGPGPAKGDKENAITLISHLLRSGKCF